MAGPCGGRDPRSSRGGGFPDVSPASATVVFSNTSSDTIDTLQVRFSLYLGKSTCHVRVLLMCPGSDDNILLLRYLPLSIRTQTTSVFIFKEICWTWFCWILIPPFIHDQYNQ
ncbi:hypothetical protein AV530_011722 [Patagioenas fasciata monilis]|uniref:Uncharacterized protein n=1 Tax=Patagioenas fasciata monilis TaxID=372326 RepID=A0A1V4KLD5_PATFA|nr:hypothetical protein AV530_011722 [Patagioenas fasciata monilis]